jgi:hypothetical protein
MTDENRGGPARGGANPGGGPNPGGGRGGDNRPGGGKGGPGGGRGGGDRRDGNRGGPRKGGKGGAGPAKPVRVETYDTLTEVLRGPDFKIHKRVIAEKGAHRPIKTEYRLTREGLKDPQYFPRLSDAQAASTAPLPEPEPEPEPVVVEAEADASEAPAEPAGTDQPVDTAEPAPAGETGV